MKRSATFGERLSDHVASVGGSWGFIIAFTVVLFGWMILNSQYFEPHGDGVRSLSLHLPEPVAIDPCGGAGAHHHDEPEPAGGQGPPAAAHDYEVNLRAELEILRLHEKVNHLIEQVGTLNRPEEEQSR
jgi:hypothetical protein